jgi:hypothetical protein
LQGIQHAGNGREHQIEIEGVKYKVDGYIKEHNHAIEFLGCHYHSHPECTNPDDVAPNGKLNSINYIETMERIEKIRSYGANVEIGMLFLCYFYLAVKLKSGNAMSCTSLAWMPK